MYKGLVDTDTNALQKRIAINKNSKFDFEKWIIDNLEIEDGMSILDLGCGTGKQIKAIRNKFKVRIVGIDMSIDGLNFEDQDTTLICANFDENIVHGKFDRIISTYAIYYSKSIESTINRYMSMLLNNGLMFLVGFGKKTNDEFYQIVNQVIEATGIYFEPRVANDFMTKIPNEAEVVRLENKVYFESKEKTMEWWENHNSYIKEIADQVHEKLPENLQISKNTMGVILRKNK
jgi:cyclopropane fatty-acyl-phospholipid synthase-like methyltransferase